MSQHNEYITKELLEQTIRMILSDIKTNDDNLRELINSIDNGEENTISPLYFDTYANFPTIGDASKLYIDTGANKMYRYDENTVTYILISEFDPDDIEYIQCTL